MSPVSEIVFWKFKKLWPTHCCPLLAKETVLGPMSLKERGDRRRPRTANLVQFAVTSNCASTKRLGARSLLDFRSCLHQITFCRAALQSPGLPKAYRPRTADSLACRAEDFGDMRNLHKPFVRSQRWNRAFDNRPVSCRVQPSVVSLPQEMRNVLR
jgi:hypothetical protein